MTNPKHLARTVIPAALIAALAAPGKRTRLRWFAALNLAGFWAAMYRSYRTAGLAQTREEWEILRRANWEAFTRHYNERVPTIEEEFDLWGAYHQHRHEMRYDLVAALVRRHLPHGGRVLDVGCGSALVADRILDLEGTYVGVDFGGHQYGYAAKKLAAQPARLRSAIAACDGEQLPFTDGSFDVVVMSEVIEHLLRPERAVWEVSRVLRPGGVFIMTTNNASEVPCRSPFINPLAWVEKAVGADHPSVISLRPWVWPEPVDPELLPPGSPPIHLPHTHHIQAQTRAMFAAAGLDTFHWSTFEFPPPQAAISQWLDKRGAVGRRVVDGIEAVATRTPLVNRLGCHVLMVSRKERDAVAPEAPPGLWPGPFSGGSGAGAGTGRKAAAG